MDKQLAIPFDDGGKKKKKKISFVSQHAMGKWVEGCKTRDIRPTLKEAVEEVSELVGFRVNTRSLRAVMNELKLDMDSFFRQDAPDPRLQSPMSTLHIRVTGILARVEALEARVRELEGMRID